MEITHFNGDKSGKSFMALRLLEHALKLGFTEDQILEAFEEQLNKEFENDIQG